MGLLVDGQWQDKWYDTSKSGGKFERQASSFRDQIAPGSAHPVEKDRYHLYVSLACPWAHRTLIFRKLKQLEDWVSVSVVHPDMLENGWEFRDQASQVEGAFPDFDFTDHVFSSRFMHQIYTRTQPTFTGRVTVPVLFDYQENKIVNNESADIIRMFNTAFNDVTGNTVDFYPKPLRSEIDELNSRIYDTVNNGVYKCGFATTQSAYEEAFDALFTTLEYLENRLGEQRYLVGDNITEADWRLFTTLIRFDAVYVGHFKTNLFRIADKPNLSGYVRDLYQQPGVAETVNMSQIKRHYYYSHHTINPTRVIPKGPDQDFQLAHTRGQLGH